MNKSQIRYKDKTKLFFLGWNILIRTVPPRLFYALFMFICRKCGTFTNKNAYMYNIVDFRFIIKKGVLQLSNMNKSLIRYKDKTKLFF